MWSRAMIMAIPLRLRLSGLSNRVPSGLVAAPTDLRAVDPYVAQELVLGRIALAGRVLETGGLSPFKMEMPSSAFEERLHVFGWLRHVRASRSDDAYNVARMLVNDWIGLYGRTPKGLAWLPDTAAQRLISWLSHSPVVLQKADSGFYRRFLRCINLHVRYLRLVAKYAPDGEVRLKVRIALAMASISMPNRASKISRCGAQLDREVERQIFPDGGHVSRNPRVILELLLDLLPLRQSYINLGHDVPPGLVPAIDRMFPAIRFFRHQDGDLALFNGATATLANELASVLRYDETAGRPSRGLPDIAYHRLSVNDTVIIIDTGAPQSIELSRTAHCGCLSFELSSGRYRFIVNSGFPQYATADFKAASRSTAAHSTVTVGDRSSSRISKSRLMGPICISAARITQVERHTDQKGADVISACHAGYLDRFGYLHHRELELNASGSKIRGRDWLTAGGKNTTLRQVDAISRFHIHPLIELFQENEETVILRAPDATTWAFTVPGRKVSIEEDVFMADASGIRPSRQMEIAFSLPETSEIRWLLERRL
ncbi:heparinase [Agrobacterium larrymoorei]|nr:heparinase [Agrobacterium larrymoorei]